jgi:hypothetical protein
VTDARTFADQPVALYRHLDVDGWLLYVGITSDPARRWLQHLETSLWARYAATTWVQWWPDRESARRAERRAIVHEAPLFNLAGPGRSRRSVVDRRLTYLQTGCCDGYRRVPCRAVVGEFCIACGPDAERRLDDLELGAAC